ncbi:MAG: primosomal protein N', partial [Solirubrobacterales bacterium]|nr:primosomal protein N' [Solirubrobacterales bacterium]
MIARVQPLTRTRAVRGPFDYRLGAEHGEVGIGSVLRVPFGGRATLGVVVALAERSELAPDRLAEPQSVLPAELPPDLVALAGWMAGEYCSTPARALRVVLSAGAADVGRPRRALVAELTEGGRDALAGGVRLTAKQRAALTHLLLHGASGASQLGLDTARRLQARGLVTLEQRIRPRRPPRHAVGSAPASAPQLTEEQRRALESVLAALCAEEQPASRDFLLHGVTGSGKTEVYLGAVAATLARGRSAIVLVPEIALTPQSVERFRARLGEVVAVLHSGLRAGERYDEWLRMRAGEARVCVGARSAVFAPLSDLGLIVIDEEHEGSYKHEGDPRYDARSVAEHRARQHGAVLLAGSATPRAESVSSKRRLALTKRIDGRALPAVEVLDMRGLHHPLHPETRVALADLRRAEGKAIALVNRRGWSNFLSCKSCGHVWLCPNCEVALVLHRTGSLLACHHCGHRETVPGRCPACASISVARHGAGTERVEHELIEALGSPAFPIFRLDADSTSLSERARTLQRFQAAPGGVLVGTQMVAKGHDFQGVSLGIVLDADQTLRFPDFRAEERTFALVTQLAGRTGRGRAGGRVLVQTLSPAARAIAFAAQHDADGFLADELVRREALRYPPYATLIRVVCAAREADAARSVASALRGLISPPDTIVLGPAPLFRLRARARSQLVIKASDRSAAIRAVG